MGRFTKRIDHFFPYNFANNIYISNVESFGYITKIGALKNLLHNYIQAFQFTTCFDK